MEKEEAISYLQNLLQNEIERKRKMKENIKWLSRVIKDLRKEIKRRKKENDWRRLKGKNNEPKLIEDLEKEED